MSSARVVHVVLPAGIDDPDRPSGGNTYDRWICRGLVAAGWRVVEHQVPGGWPDPDSAARANLAAVIAALPDRTVLLADGLIASTVPEVLVPHAGRLRMVVLVHLPLGVAAVAAENAAVDVARRELAVLSAAAAVVATSTWTRNLLLDRYPLLPRRIHVAAPGVDPAEPVAGSAAGDQLLCVAAVAPHKGHDVLVEALARIDDLSWRCVCVGAVTRDIDFIAQLRRRAEAAGIADRVLMTGPLTGRALDTAYAGADVLVLATRGETYGMVVTEALARGLPVIASDVGGLPDALGRAPDGVVPGLLVRPDDPAALAAALRSWLSDADLRGRLRRAAGRRRAMLGSWAATTDAIERALTAAAA